MAGSSAAAPALSSRERYTFHGNLRQSRHGWLRLTPAYSVNLVRELVQHRELQNAPVLDPFCGTGTTLLACAELSIPCHTLDINPFLVWLARAKTCYYPARDIADARRLVEEMTDAASGKASAPCWTPPLFNIERWWSPARLSALGRAMHWAKDHRAEHGKKSFDLALLAFCRAMLRVSNAHFGHQSMSFATAGKASRRDKSLVAAELMGAFEAVSDAARQRLGRGARRVVLGDARRVPSQLPRYGCVVTSPPYSNRISYIRELRPYMYWLGYLGDAQSAGALDWRAIGGTWGAATSNLMRWSPSDVSIPYRGFRRMVSSIEKRSVVLGRYVHKYFEDMQLHLQSLKPHLLPGAELHYIVGNSKFYDTLVPTERILAAQFEALDLRDVRIDTLRKRTSKRELFEFSVSARR